ncbi:unnamed protein product [Acanthoscelides obtectus]|uniref:Uncharacterized protein n=1 Tax=Acanthoscelides obtectus TaxID=200917 RepID=A0A9P0K0R9_ACAOB|nr:unnamed protein product [Acanthoscelides obtectus]CAK1629092.1 hypothetical protein AOBTE_LOCUS5573 [Acanthoscelides obtectus]
MFGNKLRSWVEAVRSRKKQNKKEKQGKTNMFGVKNTVKWNVSNKNLEDDFKESDKKGFQAKNLLRPDKGRQMTANANHPVSRVLHSKYSANNLSSPESAYSTGYSTDGTSPGAAPENMLNSSKGVDGQHPQYPHIQVLNASSQSQRFVKIENTDIPAKVILPSSVHLTEYKSPIHVKDTHRASREPNMVLTPREVITGPSSPALGVTSPRQRNRIRTNPWLPGGALSPSPVKHEITAGAPTKTINDSPETRRLQGSLVSKRKSISYSSCSSLSGVSIQIDVPKPRSASDEDCTLNEMMGKFDESYVYEKETDILSDSDPTDCETDIDTGQDGGDEEETELDFIDNCSYLELKAKTEQNTGHCTYHSYEVQKKKSSRRRVRRSNKSSEKRCGSSKKRNKQTDHRRYVKMHQDGSKSAGATPVSVRRFNARIPPKLPLEDCLKRRSNSISLYHEQIPSTIEMRDKEAGLKYLELITKAEQILRTMKANDLSPRRVPGPANKRVELLRTTETPPKSEGLLKARPAQLDEVVVNTAFSAKIPSNNNSHFPRYSPQKNHITKFISSNSPFLTRREIDAQSNILKSPRLLRKAEEQQKNVYFKETKFPISPKYRQKTTKRHDKNDSSSDSDTTTIDNKMCAANNNRPQSEPVRRKMYQPKPCLGKRYIGSEKKEFCTGSDENLRQQVILNTIEKLKKNLEDHSASLKQLTTHNMYV